MLVVEAEIVALAMIDGLLCTLDQSMLVVDAEITALDEIVADAILLG